eukprot:6457882-Amphidinium_carterae.1
MPHELHNSRRLFATISKDQLNMACQAINGEPAERIHPLDIAPCSKQGHRLSLNLVSGSALPDVLLRPLPTSRHHGGSWGSRGTPVALTEELRRKVMRPNTNSTTECDEPPMIKETSEFVHADRAMASCEERQAMLPRDVQECTLSCVEPKRGEFHLEEIASSNLEESVSTAGPPKNDSRTKAFLCSPLATVDTPRARSWQQWMSHRSILQARTACLHGRKQLPRGKPANCSVTWRRE